MHSAGGSPAALPGHPQYEPEEQLPGPHGAPVLTHILISGQQVSSEPQFDCSLHVNSVGVRQKPLPQNSCGPQTRPLSGTEYGDMADTLTARRRRIASRITITTCRCERKEGLTEIRSGSSFP